MLTKAQKAILAGVVAGLSALLLAGPAAARIPEGGQTGKQRAARVGVLMANAVYVTGCKNGTIADRVTGGDNNNYEYFGTPCG